MQKIHNIMLYVLATIAIFFAVSVWLDTFERSECLRWKQQALQTFEVEYYILPWQKAQCDAHGIDIPAPVR